MAEGFAKRKRNRTNELIFLAWNTAALTRVEKMPDLKDLYESEPKRDQTDEEMLTVVKSLNAAFGGEVVEV